jgi:hypothetical protein
MRATDIRELNQERAEGTPPTKRTEGGLKLVLRHATASVLMRRMERTVLKSKSTRPDETSASPVDRQPRLWDCLWLAIRHLNHKRHKGLAMDQLDNFLFHLFGSHAVILLGLLSVILGQREHGGQLAKAWPPCCASTPVLICFEPWQTSRPANLLT